MTIKGYKFYIRPDGATDWVAANSTPQENPDYTFTDLASGTDYEITAVAVDMAGNESDMATPLDVSTLAHNPTEELMSAANIATIDGIITPKLGTAGCQVHIVGPEGYYRKAYGTAYGRDLTLDDKMRYGSITKCATATLILAQVDAGHLSLDDTIDQFVDGITYGDRITIQMLLMTRAGI